MFHYVFSRGNFIFWIIYNQQLRSWSILKPFLLPLFFILFCIRFFFNQILRSYQIITSKLKVARGTSLLHLFYFIFIDCKRCVCMMFEAISCFFLFLFRLFLLILYVQYAGCLHSFCWQSCHGTSVLHCHCWLCMFLVCHFNTPFVSSKNLAGSFNSFKPDIYNRSICALP